MQITKRTKIIWGILALLILACGVMWWMLQPVPPPPRPVIPASKVLPKVSQGKQREPATSQPAVGGNQESASPTALPLQMAGTLGQWTKLKGSLEELKLQYQIEELQAKQQALRKPPAPVVTVNQPALSLPDLNPPASRRGGVSPSGSTSGGGTVVVSIQGVDGNCSATIRSGGKNVTVRRGTRFGGGIVTDISRRGVILRRGTTTSTLPFE